MLHAQRQGFATPPPFRLDSGPEYRLCGASLRTAIPIADEVNRWIAECRF
jgi:hypothetical protein